ncbi:MAG: TonB-dependent receptor [Cellvibrionaceae bacterium]
MTIPVKPITTTLSALTIAISLASTGALAEGIELEEIVVTAQKREQNLQDVPVAVSAFTGEQLKEAVIKDVFDLQSNTPGLRVGQNQNNNTANFSIRGVGTSSQNFGLESSVGLYVDGTYRSRQSTMISDMIDIEAVEVLRGPQGTLFGKNTPSGAVLFRTKAPSFEPDAYVSVTAGNYGLLTGSAGGNLTLIEDELAIRGTIFSSERDGYIDVDGFGSDVMNDRDRVGGRLQALWEPTEDLSIRVIADYSEIDEICCGALSYVDNVNVIDPNVGPRPGSDTFAGMLGGTVFEGDQTDSYRTALNILPESQAKDRGLSIDISWDIGDYTLNSITSYRKYNSRDIIDSDFSNVDIIETENDAAQKSLSQELRLDYTSENLSAVVGLYYFTQEIDLDYNLYGGDNLGEFADLEYGLGALAGGVDLISGLTGGLVAPSAEAFPDGFLGTHLSEQEHDSWAVFGQFDYNLTEKLVLTAGIRYTEESKDMNTVFNESINGTPWVPGASTSLAEAAVAGARLQALGGGAAFVPSDIALFAPYSTAGWGGFLFPGFYPREDIIGEIDDEQVTGTIKLSWFVTEDTMVYASYGTGYKSGGTNTDRIAPGLIPIFDAETSTSFELGLKSEFPEQALRINAALHLTETDDFQANAFTGAGFNLQNAGQLESYGGELEVFWQPLQNTVVTLAYAYSHADFEKFESGDCWIGYTWQTGTADPGANGDGSCDRSGDRISGNPEHFANLGVKQNFALGDGVDGYVYGEYTYLSDQVLDNNNDPLKHQESYGLLNLRAGISWDEYGLDLTFWGRNVLDKTYKRTTFDVPVQSGKLMSYPSEPRTYGLTLNKAF